jgi:hypothetical protein
MLKDPVLLGWDTDSDLDRGLDSGIEKPCVGSGLRSILIQNPGKNLLIICRKVTSGMASFYLLKKFILYCSMLFLDLQVQLFGTVQKYTVPTSALVARD